MLRIEQIYRKQYFEKLERVKEQEIKQTMTDWELDMLKDELELIEQDLTEIE